MPLPRHGKPPLVKRSGRQFPSAKAIQIPVSGCRASKRRIRCAHCRGILVRQRIVISAACAIMLVSCEKSETASPPIVAATDSELPTAELPAPVPTHNFVEEERGTYYYVTAVSEEDQKKGKAVGDVLGYRYLGKNDKGQHVLASVADNGRVIAKAYCSEPCTIIKYGDGERIAYNPNSIIGSAFQDAINGLLTPPPSSASTSPQPSGSNTSPSSSPSPTETASDNSPWVGRYVGSFEGGAAGDLSISAASAGRISVSLSMGAASGCTGDISGTAAAPHGQSLTIIKPRDDSGNQCRLTFFRRGDRMDISEDGCGYFHGFECSFSGQARRR